ncbi:type VI secretion system accessory protein TagJ [Morganella psychrotolerans]|uniref:type VI secretion system accessory protein TagJ n=1 Tax=Morganella psychrotolerans TaxID=368603 RepID=UPI001390266F|nr:type VI secretion system accessory protein TagJ [Morganella psychrotolerans]
MSCIKNLVFSEILREEILKGKREPMTLQQELPEWMKSIWEANKLLIENKLDKSEALRLQAFENAPAVGGSGETIGDFAWMADNDSRLGPICEFIVAGGYRWVPFADIETINIVKPRDLLDLIWIHAQVKVKSDIFLWLYPGSLSCT